MVRNDHSSATRMGDFSDAGSQLDAYFHLMGEEVETVIVGGGQAGLAVGYHLAQLGRSFVILDANERPGDSWRRRWDSLRLFTPAYLSDLPGLEFPGPRSRCPSKDEMADYLEAYAARFDLPIRNNTRVQSVTKIKNDFVITAGDHRFEADNVVLATGGYQAPYVPNFANQLDASIVQLHSSEYRRPAQLSEGAVLVVGAANSGAEIALEVAATHRTWLSGTHPGTEPARPCSMFDRILTPPFWFFISRVASVANPIGRRMRPHMLATTLPLGRVRPKDLDAAGVVRLPRTIAVREGRPVMEDGQIADIGNVIWSTGYRPSFDWVRLDVFDHDGRPVHDRGITAEPGCYFPSGCSFSRRSPRRWWVGWPATPNISLDILPHAPAQGTSPRLGRLCQAESWAATIRPGGRRWHAERLPPRTAPRCATSGHPGGSDV